MGRTWVVGAMVGLFVAAAGIAGAQAALPYTQTQDVVYGEVAGTGLLMDVFAPKAAKNGLGIIDVVSGAWYSDRRKLEDHKKAGLYDVFCSRGYTVFAIRPGSVSKYTALEMVQHVKRGIRYVKLHAAEYGVDPARLGLTGASAGAHLAALAVVTADPPKPAAAKPIDKLGTQVKAVAIFFPPTDFLNWGGKPVDFSAHLGGLLFDGGVAGHSPQQIAQAARRISPALLVHPNLPPFLVIHGDADTLVPLQQSQELVKAIKAAGGSAELIVKSGGGHAWPTIRQDVKVMADFFDQKLAAPAPAAAAK